MASSHGPLSLWYDTLTGRYPPYGEFADFYEERFNIDGGEFKTLLDLCCGTVRSPRSWRTADTK